MRPQPTIPKVRRAARRADMRFLGPNPRPDGLVARNQTPRQGEQEHEGMVSDFFGAVIGDVADDDA